MIRIVAYIAFALLAYVGFLLVTFPAERAFALLNKEMPELRVAGLSGSAWSGQADVLQLHNQQLENVAWQLKPWSVLLGELEVTLDLDSADAIGNANVALTAGGEVNLSEVDMQLAAAKVSSLLKLPLDLGGRFQLQLDSAEIKDNILLSALGQIRWQQATVTSPISQGLGEFSAQLTTEADGVKAQIKDEGGPLQLEGVGTLKPDGSYDFEGAVSVRDPQQTLLVQGLMAMGRPQADGRVPIRYSGRM